MKEVKATKYAHNSRPAFRQTLMYLRTEVRFYKELIPYLCQQGFEGAPNIFHAHYDLQGLIREDKKADQSKEAHLSSILAGDGKGSYMITYG